MIKTATSYLRAGLCVLPADPAKKFTTLGSWKAFQGCLPSEAQVTGWFAGAPGICIIAGAVSGNLEAMDFDCRAEAYPAWAAIVESQAPGLIARLVIETSQSGGMHIIYRVTGESPRSGKLAAKLIILRDDEITFRPDGAPHAEYSGKKYVPRKVEGRWRIEPCLIETKGEGGLFLCAPTPGYTLQQGQFEDLPVLSTVERSVLMIAARSLNELVPPVQQPAIMPTIAGRPGDDFNERGDLREILQRHGWKFVRAGENEHWRRPGKDCGTSATLKDRVFYVFTSSAPPLEADTAYSPFKLYALLEHSGDYAAAASALRAQGYGQEPDISGVDLSAFTTRGDVEDDDPPEPTAADPGPMPDELLRIPGFISQVMDYSLATAPYPNTVLAFSGALSLQAFLAGRKVRDPADNRTNLYLLGLAHSAAGKDHPRKVNTRIIHAIGLADCLGDKFASGEGVQDAMFITPCMMFQTDEIDGMLQSINKARDARHESIMSVLLTMFSSANSIFPMRRKAGKQAAGVIDQPCLCIFGTAIPNHYYEALSERMLTNGFFARLVILESAIRAAGQEPRIAELPHDVLNTAKWWADFRPGPGNLERWHPEPATVEQSDGARATIVEARMESETEYKKAEYANDPVGTTVWGRVSEQVRKLSLLYAISENHRTPIITEAAARWASRFVLHQTRRMLFMAGRHVADSPFEAECLKLLGKLREAPGRQMPHSVLLKRMKMESKRFIDMVSTLEQRHDLESVPVQAGGRPGVAYRLHNGKRCAGGVKEGVKYV